MHTPAGPARSRRTMGVFIAVLALLGCCASAHAAIFLVGGGGGACQYTSIQAAIDAAAANPGPDTIRIAPAATADGRYLQQQLSISGQVVTLDGGYASCASAAPTQVTGLDGAGGSANSVISISGNGNDVRLLRLRITGGDESSDAYGGGVGGAFGGTLRIEESEISNNSAGFGGGIYVSSGTLVLGPNVRIIGNSAGHDGGGIMLNGGALRADADGIYIGLNRAEDGEGGGIAVRQANADLGSPGGFGLPMLHLNRAKYGGALSITTGDLGTGPSRVRLYSTDATRPIRLSGNVATATGGAVFLRPSSDVSLASATATLCASDFRIDDNRAVEGSAIYADSDYSLANDLRATQVYLNPEISCESVPARPNNAVRCTGAPGCNSIDGNEAGDDIGATTGATILLQNAGALVARNVELRDNLGGRLLRVFGDVDHATGRRALASFDGCLIAGNAMTQELMRLHDAQVGLSLTHCTVTDNTSGGSGLFVFDSQGETPLTLQRSIVWQPGATLVAGTPSARTLRELLVSETASLAGATDIVEADPRFLDAQYGDYRLQAASPAVDFTGTGTGSDLDGAPRRRDLPVKIDRNGTGDLGAYERQLVGNLVLNPQFPPRDDTPPDLFRRWSVVAPERVVWSNEDAAGGTGSAYITYTPPIVPGGAGAKGAAVAYAGLRQCVNLPGSAVYSLNGSTRVPGTAQARDYARVHWTLRHNDASCSGPADAQGDHFLARSSSWSTAAPAAIALQPGTWTGNSTLELALEVLDGDLIGSNEVNAVFDAITLTVIDLEVSDIFADGFEN
jgi:hypothetical protein